MGRNRQPTRETVQLWRRPDSFSAHAGGCAGGWAPDTPPSAGAAIFLALSMFLCGCVLAGLVFVAIWRHTATGRAQSQAAQQSLRRQLLDQEQTLATVQAQLARNLRLLARARRQAAGAATALAQNERATRALARSLTPRLHDLIQSAATLAGQSATLESELTALETYARHPGAAGLDAGYLMTQTRYLARSAVAATAAATALAQESHDARAILDTATHSLPG